ncbi:hypothetical protein H0H92_012761 [Tricholoma furcatifolium]|nr:hypothetical protein H0H92_012761 [Tricholoma furcatifolium]
MIVSPRSANYERLEGGMGPSRMQQRRFAWKKFAVGAVVFIGLVYFFGPRETRFSWHQSSKPATTTSSESEAPPSNTHIPTPSTQKPKPAPATFETDPDPLKTTHCTQPYSAGSPLVQYALMIDAGSTGSRIHIYKFNNCGSSPAFEWEVFKQTHPGLSSFSNEPIKAARSLDVLMEEALRVVPPSLRKCTPVAVKATAGLRLLPGSQSQDILNAVEERLKAQWEFPLAPGEPVTIMDGKDEGVYAWITANYLLGTLEKSAPADGTYAVLDLGGASTQIAFEPKVQRDAKAVLAQGDHRYELTMAGREHVLYQHSYLGYGLMRARNHVHQLVDFMAGIRANGEVKEQIGNPCLAKGTTRTIDLGKKNVTMIGEDIGSFDACSRVMELVMAKDAICEKKPCSFNGVYQPSILDTFPTGPILLLSYFYDRLSLLLPSPPSSSPDTPITLNISTIADTARKVCEGRPAWLDAWGTHPDVMAELQGRPEFCLDLTFMYALLRLGYEFDDAREVKMAKKVDGTELGWCLGATLAVVAGDLKCTD